MYIYIYYMFSYKHIAVQTNKKRSKTEWEPKKDLQRFIDGSFRSVLRTVLRARLKLELDLDLVLNIAQRWYVHSGAICLLLCLCFTC